MYMQHTLKKIKTLLYNYRFTVTLCNSIFEISYRLIFITSKVTTILIYQTVSQSLLDRSSAPFSSIPAPARRMSWSSPLPNYGINRHYKLRSQSIICSSLKFILSSLFYHFSRLLIYFFRICSLDLLFTQSSFGAR